MERSEPRADLIDLGAASVETRGPFGDIPDIAGGRMAHALTDD